MKTRSLILFIASLLISFSSLSCDIIYLNVGGSVSEAESKVVRELKDILPRQYEDLKVIESDLLMYSHLENTGNVLPNALILDLQSETDMTGSEVKVSIYRTSDSGEIYFQGSQMEGTHIGKGKVKTLKDLAYMGINFSCGNL